MTRAIGVGGVVVLIIAGWFAPAATGRLLITFSIIVFLWAVVSLLRPSLARLPHRMAAVWVWALSAGLFIGGAVMLAPPPEDLAADPPRSQPGQSSTPTVGAWSFNPQMGAPGQGRAAAVYPGRGRINLVVTCAAGRPVVSITADRGRFDVGTVLAEWSGGNTTMHDARVLQNGASLGLDAAEFVAGLRTRGAVNLAVYLAPNAITVLENLSLRGADGAIGQLPCAGGASTR